MLKTKRILEFSKNLSLLPFCCLLFLFCFYLAGSYLVFNDSFMGFLQVSINFLLWLNAIYNALLFICVLIHWFADNKFPFSAILQTVIQFIVVILIGFLFRASEYLINSGISLG